jgi:hypothetical protein
MTHQHCFFLSLKNTSICNRLRQVVGLIPNMVRDMGAHFTQLHFMQLHFTQLALGVDLGTPKWHKRAWVR